ncbi:MAG TPA: ABC transporter substrate-binding protein [Verrucomicrobiae bacterium]|nr:ABC transporter substrate-binding protein [Verrucomicrobiae bacterium]
MDRRAFIGALAGGLLAAPLAAEAQPATKVPRVGFVEAGSRSANQHFLDAFRQGLRDLKYIEGQTIFVEDRWADGRPDRFPELIADLIRLQVDVLVVASTPGADAAKKITSSVPVVSWGVADPAGTGLVASLGHPGGNITGVALGTEDGLAGKWAELLKEGVPTVTQVAVLGNPNGPGLAPRVRELRVAAAALKLTLHIFEVRSVAEFDAAFNSMSKTHVGGLIVVVDPLTLRYRENRPSVAGLKRSPGSGRRWSSSPCSRRVTGCTRSSSRWGTAALSGTPAPSGSRALRSAPRTCSS